MTDIEHLIRRIVREEIAAAQPARRVAPVDGEQLLSTNAVADLLGCSRRALQERFGRALRAGEEHPLARLAITIDGARRWRRADVLAYIATVGDAR